MAERNVLFEYKNSKLQDRKDELEKLKEKIEQYNTVIEESTDIDIEKKYQLRKDRIFNDIDRITQEIQEIEYQKRKELAQFEDKALIDILKADINYLGDIQLAYKATVTHWPMPAPLISFPNTSSDDQYEGHLKILLAELKRMGDVKASCSALESFIAHLVHSTEHLELITALNQWKGKSRPWNILYKQIESELSERVSNYKPAILIKINLAEEKTTQSGNETFCRLEAWLIDNIESYQKQGKQRTGYRTLIPPGAPISEPFPLRNLESKIQPLLVQWLEEKKQLLAGCRNDPEFYVFLPKPLLPLAVDYWPLDFSDHPKRLGYLYTVVICCADRFEEAVYPIEDWHDLWEQHEACLNRKAREVFIDGRHQEVDSFIEALERSDDIGKIVGWKIDTAPGSADVSECFEELEDFFEELLIIGVPMAIWGRCNHSGIDNANELEKLLQASTLGKLPKAVKRKRLRGHKRNPDHHIGHHLSLLLDNPTLIPPQNA